MPFQTGQGEGGGRWQSARNLGRIPNQGVEVIENSGGGFTHAVYTLTNARLPVTSVGTAAGVGGLVLANLPQGLIRFLGATADLQVAVDPEHFSDFTDATVEGDISVGTVAPANADALGTDATDDNLATAAAFTQAAWKADVKLTSDITSLLAVDGTNDTPVQVVVNALVDAGDIDDDTETFLSVSGRVTVIWANLGDDD